MKKQRFYFFMFFHCGFSFLVKRRLFIMTNNTGNKKERRINAVKASKDSYFQLHWFLMYEDRYRDLTPKAKLLYGLLRSRQSLSNLSVSNGAPQADNYVDEDNNIFCIFDNVELAFLLNLSVPTIIAAKKELTAADLLEEVRVKDEPNRLYVLEPVLESDMWTFKEQLATIRKEQERKDAERKKRQKEKRREKAAEKKHLNSSPPTMKKVCDSKNLNHTKSDDFDQFCDLKFFNHVTKEFLGYITRVLNLLDLKDFSMYVGKNDTQCVLEFYKTFFNLSKYAEIELTKLMDKGCSKLLLLEAIYRAIQSEPKKPIAYIQGILGKWASANCTTLEDIHTYEKTFREQQDSINNLKKNKAGYKRKTVRKEIVPEEIRKQIEADEQKEKEEATQNNENTQQLTEDMILQEKVELLKDGFGKLTDAEIALALEKKFLTPENLKRS